VSRRGRTAQLETAIGHVQGCSAGYEEDSYTIVWSSGHGVVNQGCVGGRPAHVGLTQSGQPSNTAALAAAGPASGTTDARPHQTLSAERWANYRRPGGPLETSLQFMQRSRSLALYRSCLRAARKTGDERLCRELRQYARSEFEHRRHVREPVQERLLVCETWLTQL